MQWAIPARRLPVLLVLVAIPVSPLRAQEDASGSAASCERVDYAALRADPDAPPDAAGPTRVGAGFFVTQLREIDAVRDDFRFRGYVRATWCDPRLAFDPVADGTRERVFMAAQAEQELTRIWFPAGFLVNRAGDFEIGERVLRIRYDGTVTHDLNVSAQLSADYDLRRFPFDRQVLELEVESFRWNRDAVRWISDEATTGFARDFAIPEWRIIGVGSRIEEASAIRSAVPFSRFVFEIEIARESGFYVWKVMIPLILIVGLSWSIFWMTDEPLAGRSRITATGVLTIVAYQFVMAEDLPRIAYLTLLDQVMLVSFSLLAVTVVESMIVARHQGRDPDRARRIDRASRWIFPATYAALIALIVVAAGR